MQPGDIYQHKKGGWYTIEAVAERVEEEGGGTVVMYRSQADGKLWSQSLTRFLENDRFVKRGSRP